MVARYSCPLTPPTAPKMSGSGSWRVNGRAGTSLIGEVQLQPLYISDVLVSRTYNSSWLPELQVPSFHSASASCLILFFHLSTLFTVPRTPRNPLATAPLPRLTRGAAGAAVATCAATSLPTPLSRTQPCPPCPLPTPWPSWRRPAADWRRSPPKPPSRGRHQHFGQCCCFSASLEVLVFPCNLCLSVFKLSKVSVFHL